jgi:hypothetical protein
MQRSNWSNWDELIGRRGATAKLTSVRVMMDHGGGWSGSLRIISLLFFA